MSELARHEGAPLPMGSGVCHRGMSIVWFSWLLSVGRLVQALSALRRWHCVRRQSSLQFLLLQRSLTTVHGGMPTRTTSPVTPAITMPKGSVTTLIVSIVIICASRARRVGIVESSECRRTILVAPMPVLLQAIPR